MTEQREWYRLAALGDVMLAREVGRHLGERPQDFSLDDVASLLKTCDLVFLNLECPAAITGTPDPTQDPHVTFRCHPDSLHMLKQLRTTVVSVGNNHILDYGEAALHETLEHLKAFGIKHVGAGSNYEEANRPVLLECKNKKIAFLSHVFIYSASTRMATKDKAGVAEYRIGKILPRIKDLSASGYQVIVSMHWGSEYSFYPIPYQVKQARQMIDQGASLILGHGPHYPQGIEKYKNGEIVYSLGNFIFDEPHRFANKSFVYTVGVGKTNELLGRHVYALQIREHVPHLVLGSEGDRLVRLVDKLAAIYARKPRTFWKRINNRYFSDVVARIMRTRSLKFAFLPPLSFYLDIGFKNFVSKLRFANLRSTFALVPKLLQQYQNAHQDAARD